MKKLCRRIGCGTIALDNGYCEKHQADYKEREKNRKQFRSYGYKSLYHSPEWRRFRKQFLLENPFCEECGRPANTVHHETDHKGNVHLFFNNRFHALCASCHSKIRHSHPRGEVKSLEIRGGR